MVQHITNYFKGSTEELKKVTWPTRNETVNKTILVIIISLAVAIYLGFIDYLLTLGLEKLF